MTKVTLPVLIVPVRQKCKPPKALPPVPYWTMKKARLVRSSHRTLNKLRGSYVLKSATEIIVSVGVAKLLDPKGPFIAWLSGHKTWGAFVTSVVKHERYQQFTQEVNVASTNFVSQVCFSGLSDPIREDEKSPCSSGKRNC